MMRAKQGLTALVILTAAFGAEAAEIVVVPGDSIYAHPANARRGYVDLMVHSVVFHNDNASPITLTGLQFDLTGGAGAVQSRTVATSDLVRQTGQYAGMMAQGAGVFVNAQLLNEDGLEGVAGGGATFGASEELAPGESLILTSQYFATSFLPDQVVITATYIDHEGNAAVTQQTTPVTDQIGSMEFTAPLKGTWLMRGFPSVESHHRFIPSNEFALDFFKTGRDGEIDRGERLTADDDYGYGEPVHAIADGEVVFVIADQIQDQDALSPREGESLSDARARVGANQQRRMQENFRAALAGNLIILRHEQDGAEIFSAYGHLKPESIQHRVGDQVEQGDVIAAVGNTGDSTLTHLHFQLNAGGDPFFAKSLPIAFSNQRSLYQGQDPGLFVVFGE